MNRHETLTYAELYARFLLKFEKKTAQALRIKYKLDRKRLDILAKLRNNLTNQELLRSLFEITKSEEKVKNYIKYGLYEAKETLNNLGRVSYNEDIQKLDTIIKYFLKEIAKLTLRLRKEKKFIEEPTEKNFKNFLKHMIKNTFLHKK